MSDENFAPDPNSGDLVDDEFEFTPADLEVHHRLVREMVCSLPRGVSCRLCPGERDCPYIVDRPYGRLVVHKRPAHSPVLLRQDYVLTGRDNDPARRTPFHQALLAWIGWLIIPLLVAWGWIFHYPGWSQLELAGVFLLVTLLEAIIGVPLVRRTWKDRGGERRVHA